MTLSCGLFASMLDMKLRNGRGTSTVSLRIKVFIAKDPKIENSTRLSNLFDREYASIFPLYKIFLLYAFSEICTLYDPM